jgi:hypothetical protein
MKHTVPFDGFARGFTTIKNPKPRGCYFCIYCHATADRPGDIQCHPTCKKTYPASSGEKDGTR